MSLDLYVHCKSPKRLTTEELSKALAARRIGAAIFKDYINYEHADSGPIEFCTILGWMPSMFDFSQLTKLLVADSKKRLNRLFADGTLAYAHVDAHNASGHYATLGDDYLDSLAGVIDLQFVDFLKSSKTVNEVQTSAGRSEFSWRFQMAMCCIIAETSNGLIEEPQMGEYFFPDKAGDFFRALAE
jgi:hypothetical protein